ncbi:unnamed protein product, partial [Allacma fusca]
MIRMARTRETKNHVKITACIILHVELRGAPCSTDWISCKTEVFFILQVVSMPKVKGYSDRHTRRLVKAEVELLNVSALDPTYDVSFDEENPPALVQQRSIIVSTSISEELPVIENYVAESDGECQQLSSSDDSDLEDEPNIQE